MLKNYFGRNHDPILMTIEFNHWIGPVLVPIVCPADMPGFQFYSISPSFLISLVKTAARKFFFCWS